MGYRLRRFTLLSQIPRQRFGPGRNRGPGPLCRFVKSALPQAGRSGAAVYLHRVKAATIAFDCYRCHSDIVFDYISRLAALILLHCNHQY